MSNTLDEYPEWRAMKAVEVIQDEAGEQVLACLRVGLTKGPIWLKQRKAYVAAAAAHDAAYEAWTATPAYQEIMGLRAARLSTIETRTTG